MSIDDLVLAYHMYRRGFVGQAPPNFLRNTTSDHRGGFDVDQVTGSLRLSSSEFEANPRWRDENLLQFVAALLMVNQVRVSAIL